jgi:hypothetical protein
MRRLLCLCVFVVATTLGMAQSTDVQPVFSPLAAIPDTPTSRNLITLVDRDAIAVAYPDAQKPASTSALLNALQGRGRFAEGEAVWALVFRGLLDETAQEIVLAEDLPNALGIEVLQISQVASFGLVPEDGRLFLGDFDLMAVQSALAARGYTTDDEALWCYEGDCASGLKISFDQRNPANPFGGNLGRTQPIIAVPGMLYSAAAEAVVRAGAATIAGDLKSLADAPAYRAVAEALSSQGIVLQTTFMDGASLLNNSTMNVPMLPDDMAQTLPEGIMPIEPYMLYALADVVTSTEQAGIAAFVYPSEAAAAAALEQMTYRLTTLNSLRFRRPWAEVLTERGLTVDSQVVAADDLYVGLLRFATPLPPTTEILKGDLRFTSSGKLMPGQVYNFLAQGLYNRDDLWRLWDLTDE